MRKIVLILLCLTELIILNGCSQETITDNNTTQKPPIYDGGRLAKHLKIVEVYPDSMQRDSEFPKNVVVDLRFDQNKQPVVSPKEKEIARGDLVYLEIPKEVANKVASGNDGDHVARVIGLPGEVLEIKNGQV
ncbi:S26 family signal peptidase [Ammoniphilus sp. 3BR4]|uniref:S26 family signal peptidase n=1 Tax=Ammoniphilus sp. 3BR4 TaxID=3158265 RepID=UPI003465F254